MEMVKRSTNPGEVLPIETCAYTALTNPRWLFWMLGWDIGGMSGSLLPSKAQDLYQGDVWSLCWDGNHVIFSCCAKRRMKEGVSCSQCKYGIKPNFGDFLETCRDLRCLLEIFAHGSTSQVSWTALHFHKLPTSSRMKSFGIGMVRILCHQWSSKPRSFWASHGQADASETVAPQQVGGYLWILKPGEHD